jgi:hypothetical protein
VARVLVARSVVVGKLGIKPERNGVEYITCVVSSWASTLVLSGILTHLLVPLREWLVVGKAAVCDKSVDKVVDGDGASIAIVVGTVIVAICRATSAACGEAIPLASV